MNEIQNEKMFFLCILSFKLFCNACKKDGVTSKQRIHIHVHMCCIRRAPVQQPHGTTLNNTTIIVTDFNNLITLSTIITYIYIHLKKYINVYSILLRVIC